MLCHLICPQQEAIASATGMRNSIHTDLAHRDVDYRMRLSVRSVIGIVHYPKLSTFCFGGIDKWIYEAKRCLCNS